MSGHTKMKDKKLLSICNYWVMCNNCNYIFDTNPKNNLNDLKENILYRPQTNFINDIKFKNKIKAGCIQHIFLNLDKIYFLNTTFLSIRFPISKKNFIKLRI